MDKQIIKIAEDGKHFVKAAYFWILLFTAIATNTFQLVNNYVDSKVYKDNATLTHLNHEERLVNLESGYFTNRDILIEIRFNLRYHIENADGKYLTTDQINALQDLKLYGKNPRHAPKIPPASHPKKG